MIFISKPPQDTPSSNNSYPALHWHILVAPIGTHVCAHSPLFSLQWGTVISYIGKLCMHICPLLLCFCVYICVCVCIGSCTFQHPEYFTRHYNFLQYSTSKQWKLRSPTFRCSFGIIFSKKGTFPGTCNY